MQFPPSSCVSPIPFPLCAVLEGTHGTAPQGATLGLRIDKYRSLVMSRALCAATQQHGAVARTTHKAPTHKRQANKNLIYKMKAQSFV